MDRQPPRATSDEIDLYIRTYYSLLRSSGDVRVRAFEESHLFSRSSLHLGAESADPDLAAFAYSAGRLPDCMPRIRRLVLGQSHQQFAQAGYSVERWEVVRTRGRRGAELVARTDSAWPSAVFLPAAQPAGGADGLYVLAFAADRLTVAHALPDRVALVTERTRDGDRDDRAVAAADLDGDGTDEIGRAHV